MNEQIEKLVDKAIAAGAMVDVTFEAGGDVRVNVYPREPAVPESNEMAARREDHERRMAAVEASITAGARVTAHRFGL